MLSILKKNAVNFQKFFATLAGVAAVAGDDGGDVVVATVGVVVVDGGGADDAAVVDFVVVLRGATAEHIFLRPAHGFPHFAQFLPFRQPPNISILRPSSRPTLD